VLQGGGRKGTGCAEQAWVLRALIDGRRRGRKPTVVAFLDVRKAYDRVWQQMLWVEAEQHGVASGIVALLREWHEGAVSTVRINGAYTEWFPLERGVKQGSVLSPLLYCLFINRLVDRVQQRMEGLWHAGHRVCLLLYMDDIAIVGETVRDVQEGMDACWGFASEYRFEFNPDKCEWLIVGRRVHRDEDKLYIGLRLISRVKTFKYLGIWFSQEGRWSAMAAVAISKAKAACGRVCRWNMSKGMPGWVGRSIAEADVASRLMYGTEVWTPCDTDLATMNSVWIASGKKAMAVPGRTSNVLARGELGWKSVEYMLLKRRLKFMHKVMRRSDVVGQSLRFEIELWLRTRCKGWAEETDRVWVAMGGASGGWVTDGDWGKTIGTLEDLKWKRDREIMGSRADISRAVKEVPKAEWYLEFGGVGACVIAESRMGALLVNQEGERRGIDDGICRCGGGG
jgi:hypothetical protein